MKTYCLPFYLTFLLSSISILQTHAERTRISPIVSDLVQKIPVSPSSDQSNIARQFRILDALIWAFEGSGQVDLKYWSVKENVGLSEDYIKMNGKMNLVKMPSFKGQSSTLRIYQSQDVSMWMTMQVYFPKSLFKMGASGPKEKSFWTNVFPNSFSKAFGEFVAISKKSNGALKKKDLLPFFVAQVRLEAYHQLYQRKSVDDSIIQNIWILLLRSTDPMESAVGKV